MTKIAPPFEWTTHFVVNCERVSITVKAPDSLHKPAYVSFTGTFGGGAGQIVESLRGEIDDYPGHPSYKDALAICDAWDTLHLKSFSGPGSLTHEERQQLESVKLSMLAVQAQRFCADPEALETIDDATFDNTEDVIDSRDVIKRIEELTGAFEAAGIDPSSIDTDPDEGPDGFQAGQEFLLAKELATLRALEKEGEGYAPDWSYGETLIRKSYFAEYAEELVNDIDALPQGLPAYIVIDWEATAANLIVDYTEIDFDGVPYLIR